MTLHHRPRTSPIGSLALTLALLLLGVGGKASGQTTPWSWSQSDIGSPASAGAASFSPGLVTLTSSGADVDGTTDEFTFLHRPITGEATVIARVNTLTSADPWSQAGVMIRESTAPGSKHAFLLVSGANGVALRRRTTDGGATSSTAGGAGTVPVWLKLERRGPTFTGWRSSDGVAWTSIGSATISMSSTVLVGLGLASHKPAASVSSAFSNVMVVGDGPLPSGWDGRDLGSPTLSGGSGFGGNTFTLDGAGTGVTGTSDQFRYVYKVVTGDTDIVTRVVGFETTAPSARAGVMVRQSLAGTSAHSALLVAPSSGVYFDRRSAVGRGTVSMWGGGGAPPVWLKLSRRGNTVTAYRSADGTTWTPLGTQMMTVTDPFYVGLAVTSTDTSRRARTSFDNVTAAGSNREPTVSLTSPVTGAKLTAPASIALAASATDADGTIAKVEFFSGSALVGSDTTSPYSASWSGVPAGTYVLKAVATDNQGASTTSVTSTVTVSGNVPPVVSLTAPDGGASFSSLSPIAITATASDADGTVARVEFYAGATLLGSDTTTPFAYSWSSPPVGSHLLKAVAVDNLGAKTTSATRTIAVSTNASPVVSLTSPATGVVFTVGDSIMLTATATDADGSVARVDFYSGTTLLGTDTTSPYKFTWSGAAVGAYALTAVARDNLAAMTVSSGRDIVVVAAGLPTTVAFPPSVEHPTVDRYVLEIFRVGTSPWTAEPEAVRDLGRPAIVGGECTVNIAALISSLPPGAYFATVSAENAEGSNRSPSSLPFSR